MTRGKIGRYTKESGWTWHDKEAIADYRAKARANPIAPAVQCDTMDVLKHPKTGIFTDSKSHFDAMSRATGCVPWEPPKDWNGNGVYRELNAKEAKEIEDDIDQATRRAYNDLRDGQMPLSDQQQHFAKEVNEKYEAVTGKTSKLIGGME